MSAAPAWLHNAIVTGVQNLYALSLPGSPAAEVLPMTVEVWVRTISSLPVRWDERLDAPRLNAGFMHLAAACDRWPVPRLLLDNLPARPEPLMLPPPKPAKGSLPPAWVREKLAALSGRLTMSRVQRDVADDAERLANEANRDSA